MKSYFIRLFNYDKAANIKMLNAVISAGSPGKSVLFLSHILAAQQVWLNRCRQQPQTISQLWPQQPAAELVSIIEQNSAAWIDYLEGLQESDFANGLYYQNMQGQPFSNKLEDVLAHVINHGTHHRAQAGQEVKQACAETLPGTDYILFLREI